MNTTFHPINYAFLAQLFEETVLIRNLDPQKLYQRAPEISVPKLSSASNKYEDLIALSKGSKYELAQIVNSTKEGRKLYDSAGQLALQKFMEFDPSSFDPLSSKDWLLGLSGFITILLALAVVSIYLKLRTMSALLIVLARAKPSMAKTNFKLQYTLPPSTTVPPFSLDSLNDITRLVSLEQALLTVLVIFALMVSCSLLYRHIRRFRFGPQTFAYLQVGNVTENCTLPFVKLAFPIEFYVIRSFRRTGMVSASIEYNKFFITGDTIVVSGIELTVSNPSLGIEISLNLRKNIPFLFARKIARIIQDDHFITILFTESTGRIKTCKPLRVYSEQVEGFNLHSPNAPPLYPVLDR